MTDDTILPFAFPAVGRKKVTAAFDGGRITSDGGVMLLAEAERRLGLAGKLAAVIPDHRDPGRTVHSLADILRARIFAIACGYEDACDLNTLRCDPAFKLACGRLPELGRDLCSQPTVSRWENAPDLRSVIRLGRALLDLWLASYPAAPAAVTLDIDDTCDVVHGHQQLALFNAHYDERCFLPIHVYEVATGRPVAVILRPGKTPSGKEIRGHLRRLVRHIRRRWPATRITIRGDSHYGRPEVMDWCEANDIDYLFGLPGNTVLDRLVDEAADDIRTRRALDRKPCLRGFAETRYRAKSWKTDRRVCARIEATRRGLDIRFVVTSLAAGTPEHVYEVLYCARGQAENLIKLHKTQLASDRTSCRAPLANQVRLVLHTAAYWLMLRLRDAIPKAHALAPAEFATLRLKLLKLGARVIETASRVRLAFAASCPEAPLVRHLATALAGP
ncbi:MAG: IS1380 family transposase [Dermatophilaceae bacterium]